MKTLEPFARGAHSRAIRGFCLVAVPFLSSAAVWAAPVNKVSSVDEPKTHTLFMGADFSLEKNKAFLPVQDVVGGSFVVDAGDRRVLVPMDKGPVNLRVSLSLKLTEISASLANLKGERAYTPETDPHKKFLREQPGMMGQTQASLAWGPVFSAMTAQAAAGASVSQGATNGGASLAGAQAQVGSTIHDLDRAYLAANSDFNNVGYYAGKMQEELEKKLFDAIEVSFDLSAERPLSNPYVVIVAAYRAADDKPGLVRNWIYAQSLDPIDRTPRTVKIRRGGFPPGYELENYQVHLYNQGVEVATNVAPKRVPLTREEAFQYILIEYVSGHKNATLPAVPAMGKLPADLRTRLASGQFAQPYYVRVSKDGQAMEAFLDSSCSQKVDDPYLTALVQGLRFKPALERGKPVEGVSELRLNKLSI